MIPLSDVDWGPINASDTDAKFPAKWIEPPEIKNCLDHSCWIVTGEKGSGKSAIQRAIREVHSSDYFATPLVDFDNISFGPLYDNLVELSKTTKLSGSITLSNYWQYSVVVELIKACVEKDPTVYGDLLQKGRASRHQHTPLNERLFSLVEEAWNLIDAFTQARDSDPTSARANMLASGGLAANLLHDLSTFPLGPEYEEVRRVFFKRIAENRHRVVLILDGFDTLITTDIKASSINLIFGSLINAVLSLRKHDDMTEFLGIKALIPHDRFMSVSPRDFDKVDALHTAIRWNSETLKAFVKKRIEITPKIKPGNFQALWGQVFPEFVLNSFHKIQEDSFDYLLRHTMLRPRQLQIHLQTLARRHRGSVIDPSMVPKSVAESNRKLSTFFIGEYAIDHPGIERFILMFEQKPNVMSFRAFRDLVAADIQRSKTDGNHVNVEDKIDALYTMGLFGVVRFLDTGDARFDGYYPPTKDSKQHYVDFFFRRPDAKMSSRLRDDSLIALHPIFVDFANLRPDPTLIIG
jgi:hypothetical protein